jgi:hypothetical protein
MRSPRDARRASELRGYHRAVVLASLAAAVVAVLGGCAPNGSKMTTRPISEVLKSHTAELMAIPGVVGTGEGAVSGGGPAILVLVSRRTPEVDSRVPKRLEGYPVEVRVVGEVRKLDGR